MLISDVPMMGLSNNHAVVEAFETCGAINALDGVQTKAPQIGREGLLLMQPKLIVTTYAVRDSNLWLLRNGFSAFPRPTQVGINPDLILRQTPRMLDGIQQFCEQVDLVRQAQP